MDYNIAICDDEVIQVDLVEKLIDEAVEEQNTMIDRNIFKFSCGEELIEHCNKENFHIIFLDMEMTGMDGIEAAKKIRECHKDVILIFITGHRDYVFDVFEVDTFRYLLKPVKKDAFKKAFNDAITLLKEKKVSSEEEFLIIKRNKENIIIAYKSIYYFEKYRNKVMVVTDNEDIEFYGTFSELKTMLKNDSFIRVHQGFIANMDKIEVITSKEALLKNGKRIPVSRRNAKEVKETFLSRLRA